MVGRQFLIYVCVGLLSTAIDIFTMEALIRIGLHYGIAVSIGFGLGLVVNYIFHARVTFAASTSLKTVSRYAVLVFTNYLFTLACAFASERWFGSVILGKLMSLPIIAVNGYFFSRYWVFR